VAATKKTAKTRITAQDFAALKFVRSLALSPDGALLAYTLSWCDLEKKKYFANLHVLDTQTGESRQWTFGEHSDRAPVWSEDGTRLAFLRNEKGVDRILLIERSGGEPREIFKTLGAFSDMKWAEQDSTLIVKYRKSDPDPDAEKALEEGKDVEHKTPAVRKINRLYYRLDGDGFLPEERWQLYRLDLATQEFLPLTQGKVDVESWTLAPDGKTAAYVSNAHRDPDVHPFHMQITLLNVRTGRKKPLNVPLGEKDAVAFSPNGKYLVYIGHHNLQDAWGVEQLHPWLVDLTTGKQRNLTPGFDRQPGDITIGDCGYGLGLPLVAWSADSRKIYYQITSEGDTYLARIGLKPGTPEPVWDVPGQVGLYTVSGAALALLHLDFETIGEIQFCDDNTAAHPAFERLAGFNEDFLATRALGRTKEVHFKSGDGTRLQGWVVTPPDFNPRKKYPAILEVHGGPRTQYGRTFFHEMQYLAAEGYVVFFTNPRGSQGYGKEFAGCTVAAWGTYDYEDILAAANWMEAQPYVDKKRIGITGGSYGGYMTNLAVGRTDRFRAAVTQRSVVDLSTFAGTSDIGFQDNYEFGGYSWDNPEGYAAMSPISYADNIRTPLLILHNENDMRCAVEQAEQLYARIKIRGKAPVEFWRFPEESHGLSRGGRPDRRVIRLEGIAGWFKKWMTK
jgi:dipeptidyl aminopeptidase/acylaminoacyl peptidase